jgi:hypothetical protein
MNPFRPALRIPSRPETSLGGITVDTEDVVARTLRQGLGLLWLLDGLLQAQPALFGDGMVRGILEPAAVGQPGWLGGLVLMAAHVWAHAPVAANTVAAVLQVALGLGILFAPGRRYRAILGASVAWAIIVWLVGEGLGGLLVPGAALASGAPGSALLYAVVGGLLLAHATGALVDVGRAAGIAVGAYFALGVLLQILPGAPGPAALADVVRASAQVAQPRDLATSIAAVVRLAAWHGTPALLAVVSAALAALWWTRAPSRYLVAATAIVLLVLWWFGMDFGVFGGIGTDPNTPPLVALLMAAAARRQGTSGAALRRSTNGTRIGGAVSTPPDGTGWATARATLRQPVLPWAAKRTEQGR